MAITKILVANRGEIAIRIMRTAVELGIETVAIYAHEDRFALHRFKADESYLVGAGASPVAAYLDIDDIIRIARQCGADAIHPGYGFLSENAALASACVDADLVFIGPTAATLRRLGDKVAARAAAETAGVPVLPASAALPAAVDEVQAIAADIGFPVMLKASWGGGGRGMRVIRHAAELPELLASGRREAQNAFGNGDGYLEKLVSRARHVEVQVLGDRHGNIIHLFERDCSVQRRHQKVVERAPAPYLDAAGRAQICAAAIRICAAVGYVGAGTVEFLLDSETGDFYFIEVNPRIQVEHTVTEEVTGVDIVAAQIRIAEGAAIGHCSTLPVQQAISLNGHALQCRVTTEDPENGFAPDYGKLMVYRSPAGMGVRLDGGTAYTGAEVTPYYDSLLVKVTVWGDSEKTAVARMSRVLREFRIRGLSTNLKFLRKVIEHPAFTPADYCTNFIDTTPALFELDPGRDRATRLLRFISDVVVKGHPLMQGREAPTLPLPAAPLPACDVSLAPPEGLRQRLMTLGAAAFCRWVADQPQLLLTDTSMRDAHQSLLATRMRSHDLLQVAPAYARLTPGLFSLECWGGATFDVALRFLREDPWERLKGLRAALPNIPLQMLLRASNAVGYTNYPDNVVSYFIHQAAAAGIDIFRVFDALNNVDNMRVAMAAVLQTGAVCEAALCYSGDLLDPLEDKYTLEYYLELARQLQAAGAHMLCIKDMAGVCKPAAATQLVTALKRHVDLPLHFHTHDTTGIAAASVLAAAAAGADIVDGALDALSGLASQPNLGAIAASLAGSERDPGIALDGLQGLSDYWEGVRRYYAPFESRVRAGTADVYRHAMPGGQYSNLREQARSLGIENQWPDIARAYVDVNRLFGNIIKVTPTSKVVGDLALYMVVNGLDAEQVADPAVAIDFPDSVVAFFRGELGTPMGGFPRGLQHKVLQEDLPIEGRPAAALEKVDLVTLRQQLEHELARPVSATDLASFLMYPQVFVDFVAHRKRYGDVSRLPTPVFFYGLEQQQEVNIEIETGKTLVVSLQSLATDDQQTRLFFELNGQSRMIRVASQEEESASERSFADASNPEQVAAPLTGVLAAVAVEEGQRVARGDTLLLLEAMKMETRVTAPHAGTVVRVHGARGDRVVSRELLVEVVADH